MAQMPADGESAARPAAPDAYADYAKWKDWRGAFAPGPKQTRTLAAEFADIALEGRRVLEIGFGDGGFLAWARDRGAHVAGTELDAGLRDAAATHGFVVHEPDLAARVAAGDVYDVVVAYDVLEHFDTAELIAALRDIRALLAPGGILVARFPNGQSPFGRVFQHGDFTHKSTLSTYKIEYLALTLGFEVVRIDDEKRVSSKPGWLPALRHRWLALRRRMMERKIARLYGIRRLPLAPNLVAVLRRPEH